MQSIIKKSFDLIDRNISDKLQLWVERGDDINQTKDMLDVIDTVKDLIMSVKTEKDIILYRGCYYMDNCDEPDMNDRIVSFTSYPHIAESFGTVHKIKIPKGSNIFYMSAIDKYLMRRCEEFEFVMWEPKIIKKNGEFIVT